MHPETLAVRRGTALATIQAALAAAALGAQIKLAPFPAMPQQLDNDHRQLILVEWIAGGISAITAVAASVSADTPESRAILILTEAGKGMGMNAEQLIMSLLRANTDAGNRIADLEGQLASIPKAGEASEEERTPVHLEITADASLIQKQVEDAMAKFMGLIPPFLPKLNKDELVDLCSKLDIAVPPDFTKAQIIELITSKVSSPQVK